MLLVGANLVLAGFLLFNLSARRRAGSGPEESKSDAAQTGPPRPVLPQAPQKATHRSASVSDTPPPATVFARVYSTDAKAFTANLRAIQCPEATVRDIVVAEISRRFWSREEALRSKPADHVPFGWSAQTSESKLLQRRQQATALAREQTALLREALGYEVPVQPPTYAMTSSEQGFETELATRAPDVRSALRQVQEDYWSKVQTLQDRTKGFWQSGDVAELEQLKKERQETINRLVSRP
jgi:hypothetical protein